MSENNPNDPASQSSINSNSPYKRDNGLLGPVTIAKGLIGALLGGVIGYFLFVKLHEFGLYAFVLPGALTGLGCGMLAKSRHFFFAVLAALVGIVSATVAEYNTLWFVDDDGNDLGFLHFVKNLHNSNNGLAIIAVALSGAVAFWLGRRG